MVSPQRNVFTQGFSYSRGRYIWNFFKAGTILQVEITMVIYETWGSKLKRCFENFAVLTFNPPPTPSYSNIFRVTFRLELRNVRLFMWIANKNNRKEKEQSLGSGSTPSGGSKRVERKGGDYREIIVWQSRGMYLSWNGPVLRGEKEENFWQDGEKMD